MSAAGPTPDWFDTQLRRLVQLGYPSLAGASDKAFTALAEPLRPVAAALDPPGPDGAAPAVLVVGESLVPPQVLVPLLRLPGSDRPGVLDRNHGPDGLEPYRPPRGSRW